MTPRSRLAWLAVLVAQAALPSVGQDAPPAAPPALQAAGPADEYDLQRCVDVALARNPSIRVAAASVSVAMADLKQAKGLNDPKLTAIGGASLYQSDPSFSVPGLGRLVFGQRLNVDASLQFDFPLYTGGQSDAAEDQARAGVRAATYAEIRANQGVALQAVEAYFGVLKARGAAQVAGKQLEALQAQNRAVSEMYKVGLVARLDALRVAAALASAEEAVVVSHNAEKVAMAALRAVLDLPPDTPVTVVERYEDVALPATLDEALAEAQQQRADLHEIDAHIAATEAAYRLAEAGRHFTLGLYTRADFLRTSLLPQTGVLSGGIQFRVPLFDGDQSDAGKNRAQAQKEKLVAFRDSLRDQVNLQVTEAFLAQESAAKRIASTERGVQAAEEGFELAAVGYANQVVPLTDMLDAQARRTQSQNDLVNATHDRRMAMARLVNVLGR